MQYPGRVLCRMPGGFAVPLFPEKQSVRAVQLIDRWLGGIAHRSFKIRGNDGVISIIRHDLAAGQWELPLFARKS